MLFQVYYVIRVDARDGVVSVDATDRLDATSKAYALIKSLIPPNLNNPDVLLGLPRQS